MPEITAGDGITLSTPGGDQLVVSANGGATASRAAMAAVASPAAGSTRLLAESGREGTFVFDSSNLSAQVAADPAQGIYVAPSTDTTGASGAWVRQYDGALKPRWFGAVGDGSTLDTTPVQATVDHTPNEGVIETEGLTYLVTSLTNTYGKRFIGGGGIVQTDATHGGTVRLDSYSDHGKTFFGKEYLYRLFLRIRNGGTLTGYIYGDSTVARLASTITGSISGTTLTVTDAGTATLAIGTRLSSVTGTPTITAYGTGFGGTGTYTISSSLTLGSTTITADNGGQVADANFESQVLLSEYLIRAKGIRNDMVLTNRAIGGTQVSDMSALQDIDTAGGTTDIFFIKYGINDAAAGLAGFASNLRSKLSAIRASSGYATVDNLAIVLVGPNATYDPGHGRSSTWYEQLRGIYVQAARDYQCAYFDTYAYLRDIDWAATAAGGLMMTNDFADGQAVHPKEIMQDMIWGGLVDQMIGESEITPYVSDAWQLLPLNNGWSTHGGGYAGAYASMSRDGWVTLKGLIDPGTVGAGTAVATLPQSYMYPVEAELFTVVTSGGQCNVQINTSGAITQFDALASGFLSLSGIRFKAQG